MKSLDVKRRMSRILGTVYYLSRRHLQRDLIELFLESFLAFGWASVPRRCQPLA